MPLATQFIARALTSGPRDVAAESAMGVAQSLLGGGTIGSSMESAKGGAAHAMDDIKSDLPLFVCGALRTAVENTPVFGAVFRLGESAVGRRMCESDDMTIAERQSLARSAAVDLVAPGAGFAMQAIEIGSSKPLRPVLEAISPGITQSAGYTAYAAAMRADDPDRAAQRAQKIQDGSSEAPLAKAEEAALQKPVDTANSSTSPDVDAGSAPFLSFASAGAISGKLAARRAQAAANMPDEIASSQIKSSPAP